MKMPLPKRPNSFDVAKVASLAKGSHGQTSIEYLLLLAVVAVVVIASFSTGSLVDQVHNAAQGYFNTASTVIMDSDVTTDSKGYVSINADNPVPIKGGWCPVTCPPNGSAGFDIMYGACECPPPAFGGAYCPSTGTVACSPGQTCRGQEVQCTGTVACGPCAEGEICVIQAGQTEAVCKCPNGLDCTGGSTEGGPPINSIPIDACTQCGCPKGSTYDQGDNTCVWCPACYTSSADGKSCVPIDCGNNATCDPSQPPSTQCQCNIGSIFTPGAGCVSCPACQTSTDGKTCVAVTCPSSTMFCNSSLPVSQECACPSTLPCWNGTDCVAADTTTGKCSACTPVKACGNNDCGQDSCGTVCGTNGGGCATGLTCSKHDGTPGSCACQPVVSCYGSTCRSNNDCAADQICDLSGDAHNGVCEFTCGEDSCGNACGANGGSCPSGEGCDATTWPGQCTSCTPTPGCTATSCTSAAGLNNCNQACTATAPLSCGTGMTCDTTTGNCCSPLAPCPTTSDACGADSCGNVCGTNGGCPDGQACSSSTGPGRCGCVPQSGVCNVTYPCGSALGIDTCGGVCIGTANTCPDGDICDEGQCIYGSCTPYAQCGFDEGYDGKGNNCLVDPAPTCTAPWQCDLTTGACVCLPPTCIPPANPCDSTCTLYAQCGSSNGYDSCGHSCTGTPGICASPLVCNLQTGACVCSPNVPCSTTLNCGSDSCSNSCGTCPSHQVCSSTTAGTPGSCIACTPSCSATLNCGTDNCGTECGNNNGACPVGQKCSSTTPGTAGSCIACTPTTCGALGDKCGNPPDGCGGELYCGGCSGVNSCGGGGTDYQCGCTPKTCGDLGASCGNPSDGCGGTLSCGICTGDDTCGGGGTAYQCGCTPRTACSATLNCGTNSCGQSCSSQSDGSCPQGDKCSSTTLGTPGKCETCTPKTCSQLGDNCGNPSDGCGGTLSCGQCTGDNSCGGAGTPNKCGCTPKTCAQLGDNCGTPPDGCGGTLSCGSCTGVNSCGGGSTPYQCGCTPTTACGANNCGKDSCGNPCGSTAAGSCPSGQTCNGSSGGPGKCTATFTLLIQDYANCKSCAGVCTQFGLKGTCGTESDCGGQIPCALNNSSCYLNTTSGAWNCGTGTGACLSETVSSGSPCPDGIASVLSKSTSAQTQGTCGSNPTPETATDTYTVICNP